MSKLDPDTLKALHAAREAEKEQALFYGALVTRAEAAGDLLAAERLNGLHADEQHHLSRLTARLIELGETPSDLRGATMPPVALEGWEETARARETSEIERYERLLQLPLDEETMVRIQEILEVERLHRERLGGKWMRAEPRGSAEGEGGGSGGE